MHKMLEPGDLVKIRGTKGWLVVVHASSRVLIGESMSIIHGRQKKDIMFFTPSDIIESYKGE